MTRALVASFMVLLALTPTASLRISAQTAAPQPGMQMPDPRQMSGVPLPVTDLPTGSVVVRVIRGSFANVLAQQEVQLILAGGNRVAQTNDAGRAEFTALPVGVRVKAVTTVEGNRIESQEFEVPARGGVRLMLVAPDSAKETPEATPSQESARPGTVVLGNQSRFVIEPADGALSVYAILQILNAARVPVQPARPLTFELPPTAQGAGLLEGSTPAATLNGNRITVAGPLAPGNTLVQFAYSIPYRGGTVTFAQKVPVDLVQVGILAQKAGNMQLASPQLQQRREMPADGQIYIVAQGPGIKGGESVTLTFTGLPHEPAWPRNIAMTLAAAILAWGAWAGLAARGTRGLDERRMTLSQQRDRLFTALGAIEAEHRAGHMDAHSYASQRGELLDQLEHVFAELDESAAA